jgi:hypothetical protein
MLALRITQNLPGSSMTLQTISRALTGTFFVTTVALGLGGCAAPTVRTPEIDRSVKAVAVVSLLDEQTRVDRIGLTAFNNKSLVVDQTGALNAFAIDTVETTLRRARPGWQLKDARAEIPAMLQAKKAGGVSWNTPVSAIQKDLAALASKLDVDMMFVVIDHALENSPGRGVGIRLRTMSLTSLKDANVHAVCLLVLVDRNGNQITNQWGGPATYASLPADSLGIDYDMTGLSGPDMQQKLKSLMRERLKATLESSAAGIGY